MVSLLRDAGVAEQVDAVDSKSTGTWYCAGSSPAPGTKDKVLLKISPFTIIKGEISIYMQFVFGILPNVSI